MPTTRRQAALEKGGDTQQIHAPAPKSKAKTERKAQPKPSVKRTTTQDETKEPPKKKAKSDAQNPDKKAESEEQVTSGIGTIERGHIYFFYRLKVQHETAESLDDVKNFHMVLIPRPPEFATPDDSKHESGVKEEDEMRLVSPGADAVPASAPISQHKKYRLVTIGKKKLPEASSGGSGRGRKDTFWATVTKVGDDLDALEKGLGDKTYETKTRGTRHEEPARLVGRGGYAIVNNNPSVPSKRETHLGYHISHPAEIQDSSVQAVLGIHIASSFILQVKNPLAPASFPRQAGASGAEYPENIMESVFRKGGGKKGRESYGLRFASCETTELLDYEGAQLLLIAAREGEEGLETSLGDDRGHGRFSILGSHTSVSSIFGNSPKE
ncbi:hypothetical protein V5O48_002106 [Marasmius crinis-equi]|uniref:Uncharacterized protein n=1 Tax=Marasmius crinis-equi TaxID=585013 RepID=A0ABR3FX16_9AGAR